MEELFMPSNDGEISFVETDGGSILLEQGSQGFIQPEQGQSSAGTTIYAPQVYIIQNTPVMPRQANTQYLYGNLSSPQIPLSLIQGKSGTTIVQNLQTGSTSSAEFATQDVPVRHIVQVVQQQYPVQQQVLQSGHLALTHQPITYTAAIPKGPPDINGKVHILRQPLSIANIQGIGQRCGLRFNTRDPVRYSFQQSPGTPIQFLQQVQQHPQNSVPVTHQQVLQDTQITASVAQPQSVFQSAHTSCARPEYTSSFQETFEKQQLGRAAISHSGGRGKRNFVTPTQRHKLSQKINEQLNTSEQGSFQGASKQASQINYVSKNSNIISTTPQKTGSNIMSVSQQISGNVTLVNHSQQKFNSIESQTHLQQKIKNITAPVLMQHKGSNIKSTYSQQKCSTVISSSHSQSKCSTTILSAQSQQNSSNVSSLPHSLQKGNSFASPICPKQKGAINVSTATSQQGQSQDIHSISAFVRSNSDSSYSLSIPEDIAAPSSTTIPITVESVESTQDNNSSATLVKQKKVPAKKILSLEQYKARNPLILSPTKAVKTDAVEMKPPLTSIVQHKLMIVNDPKTNKKFFIPANRIAVSGVSQQPPSILKETDKTDPVCNSQIKDGNTSEIGSISSTLDASGQTSNAILQEAFKNGQKAHMGQENLIVCRHCGIETEAHNFCMNCKHPLKPGVRLVTARKLPTCEVTTSMNSSNSLTEEPIVSKQEFYGKNVVTKVISTDKKLQLNTYTSNKSKSTRGRGRGKVKTYEEPEIFTLSSDDDDDHSKSSTLSGSSNIIDQIHGLKQLSLPMSTQVSSKEPNMAADMEDLLDSAANTFIYLGENNQGVDKIYPPVSIDCRSVRVGSYKHAPGNEESVEILKNGYISFKVPSCQGNGDGSLKAAERTMVTLTIQFVHMARILFHHGNSIPVIFIYLRPTEARNISKMLNMNESLHKFDPTGEECHKRITLLLKKLDEDMKIVLRSYLDVHTINKVTGITSKLTYEINQEDANEILVKSSVPEITFIGDWRARLANKWTTESLSQIESNYIPLESFSNCVIGDSFSQHIQNLSGQDSFVMVIFLDFGELLYKQFNEQEGIQEICLNNAFDLASQRVEELHHTFNNVSMRDNQYLIYVMPPPLKLKEHYEIMKPRKTELSRSESCNLEMHEKNFVKNMEEIELRWMKWQLNQRMDMDKQYQELGKDCRVMVIPSKAMKLANQHKYCTSFEKKYLRFPRPYISSNEYYMSDMLHPSEMALKELVFQVISCWLLQEVQLGRICDQNIFDSLNNTGWLPSYRPFVPDMNRYIPVPSLRPEINGLMSRGINDNINSSGYSSDRSMTTINSVLHPTSNDDLLTNGQSIDQETNCNKADGSSVAVSFTTAFDSASQTMNKSISPRPERKMMLEKFISNVSTEDCEAADELGQLENLQSQLVEDLINFANIPINSVNQTGQQAIVNPQCQLVEDLIKFVSIPNNSINQRDHHQQVLANPHSQLVEDLINFANIPNNSINQKNTQAIANSQQQQLSTYSDIDFQSKIVESPNNIDLSLSVLSSEHSTDPITQVQDCESIPSILPNSNEKEINDISSTTITRKTQSFTKSMPDILQRTITLSALFDVAEEELPEFSEESLFSNTVDIGMDGEPNSDLCNQLPEESLLSNTVDVGMDGESKIASDFDSCNQHLKESLFRNTVQIGMFGEQISDSCNQHLEKSLFSNSGQVEMDTEPKVALNSDSCNQYPGESLFRNTVYIGMVGKRKFASNFDSCNHHHEESLFSNTVHVGMNGEPKVAQNSDSCNKYSASITDSLSNDKLLSFLHTGASNSDLTNIDLIDNNYIVPIKNAFTVNHKEVSTLPFFSKNSVQCHGSSLGQFRKRSQARRLKKSVDKMARNSVTSSLSAMKSNGKELESFNKSKSKYKKSISLRDCHSLSDVQQLNTNSLPDSSETPEITFSHFDEKHCVRSPSNGNDLSIITISELANDDSVNNISSLKIADEMKLKSNNPDKSDKILNLFKGRDKKCIIKTRSLSESRHSTTSTSSLFSSDESWGIDNRENDFTTEVKQYLDHSSYDFLTSKKAAEFPKSISTGTQISIHDLSPTFAAVKISQKSLPMSEKTGFINCKSLRSICKTVTRPGSTSSPCELKKSVCLNNHACDAIQSASSGSQASLDLSNESNKFSQNSLKFKDKFHLDFVANHFIRSSPSVNNKELSVNTSAIVSDSLDAVGRPTNKASENCKEHTFDSISETCYKLKGITSNFASSTIDEPILNVKSSSILHEKRARYLKKIKPKTVTFSKREAPTNPTLPQCENSENNLTTERLHSIQSTSPPSKRKRLTSFSKSKNATNSPHDWSNSLPTLLAAVEMHHDPHRCQKFSKRIGTKKHFKGNKVTKKSSSSAENELHEISTAKRVNVTSISNKPSINNDHPNLISSLPVADIGKNLFTGDSLMQSKEHISFNSSKPQVCALQSKTCPSIVPELAKKMRESHVDKSTQCGLQNKAEEISLLQKANSYCPFRPNILVTDVSTNEKELLIISDSYPIPDSSNAMDTSNSIKNSLNKKFTESVLQDCKFQYNKMPLLISPSSSSSCTLSSFNSPTDSLERKITRSFFKSSSASGTTNAKTISFSSSTSPLKTKLKCFHKSKINKTISHRKLKPKTNVMQPKDKIDSITNYDRKTKTKRVNVLAKSDSRYPCEPPDKTIKRLSAKKLAFESNSLVPSVTPINYTGYKPRKCKYKSLILSKCVHLKSSKVSAKPVVIPPTTGEITDDHFPMQKKPKVKKNVTKSKSLATRKLRFMSRPSSFRVPKELQFSSQNESHYDEGYTFSNGMPGDNMGKFMQKLDLTRCMPKSAVASDKSCNSSSSCLNPSRARASDEVILRKWVAKNFIKICPVSVSLEKLKVTDDFCNQDVKQPVPLCYKSKFQKQFEDYPSFP